MKYYKVRRSTELRTTGTLSQIDEAIRLLPRNERRVYLTLDRRKWPDPMPDLDIFKLHKKAKLTDILSSSFTQEFVGLVVNAKVKNILESYKIERTRVFPTLVYSYDQKERYEYYLFYTLESQDIVDFKESKYFHTDIGGTKLYKQLKIHSVQEFYEAYSNVDNGRVIPKVVKLRKSPDLFRLPWGGSPLISEQLKSHLEKEAVTGMEITESNIEFSRPD